METQKQKWRGRDQIYKELKKPTMIALIPTGIEKLDELTAEFYCLVPRSLIGEGFPSKESSKPKFMMESLKTHAF